ncbi:MAG: PAS domain S-box protein [Holophaga sp.]|nr:PAS domain S-box protein [Holophaga sp.]
MNMFSLGRRAKSPADPGALLDWILDKDREVVYSLGADRRFRMVKGASSRLWGYGNEELLGKDFADMVVPRERRTVLSMFDGHMRGKVSGIHDSHFQKRDGTPIRMVWKLADGPTGDAILGEAREYAVRKPRTDAPSWAAVGMESYQRALDEHAIVSLADARGRILAVNDKFCDLSGYARSELLGRTYQLVNSRFHGAVFFQELWRTILAGQVWKGEIRNRAKGGEHYWVATTIVPVEGPGGAPGHFIAIQADVTALKAAEESLRETHKMESLKAFAGGVAHDFSNLLTAILGSCNLGVRDVHAESRARANFDRIEQAAMRGTDLTNQLMAYLGQTVSAMKRVDLNALVEDSRDFLMAMLPRSTRLEFHLDPAAPQVLADPNQLLQVVRTLAVNAFESLDPASSREVTIGTGREILDRRRESALAPDLGVGAGAYAFLEVRDTGVGMTQEVLRKIFDPFFTTKFIGRGLGLPAVAGIIRNHKGTVQIQSDPGRGTLVRVLLPLERESRGDR